MQYVFCIVTGGRLLRMFAVSIMLSTNDGNAMYKSAAHDLLSCAFYCIALVAIGPVLFTIPLNPNLNPTLHSVTVFILLHSPRRHRPCAVHHSPKP